MVTDLTSSERLTHYRVSDSLSLLRCFAIGLVVFQHCMSLLQRGDVVQFQGVSIGQYGVGVFCALSGFLTFQDSHSPQQWLKRRFIKIFPSYWVVMIISFFLTWLSGYKAFDLYQFISQMLGVGFFTHGWDLVNVASWFISLLLLCYSLAFLARLIGRPLLVMGGGILLAILAVGFNIHLALARHVISFNCGGLIAQHDPRWLLAVILPLVFLIPVSFQYSLAVVSLCLLMIGLLLPAFQLKYLRKASYYIYEYYLVHGIFLVGALYITPQYPVLAISTGVLSSCVAAWGLKYGVTWIRERSKRLYQKSR